MDTTNFEIWRFPRFFTENFINNEVIITGEDSKHIKNVLRMKVGDKAVISDMKGMDFLCQLKSVENCSFDIVKSQPNIAEANINVRLFQALPKGGKMEFIVQKAVELGANEIIPVLTKRCISRPDEKTFKKKIQRYNRIAYEAAKQCGRGKIPKVSNLLTFKEGISQINSSKTGIIFYECGGVSLKTIVKPKNDIDIFIGSEGGFELEEIQMAEEKGWKTATLGNRILRCETAPVVALSLIMNLTENL